MSTTLIEPTALGILRDIIEGDDATTMAAFDRGQVFLAQVGGRRKPRAAAAVPAPVAPPVADRLEMLIELSAKHYGFAVEQLRSKDRTARLVLARQVAMWLCRRVCYASALGIGVKLDRIHGTVLHGLQAIDNLRETDQAFNADLERLLARATKLCADAGQ